MKKSMGFVGMAAPAPGLARNHGRSPDRLVHDGNFQKCPEFDVVVQGVGVERR
jgi:hypothetical protein